MSAQVPGRAHRAPGPSVLVVCHTHGAPGRAHKSSDHAHQLPDTRTGRRTHPASRLTDPVRSLSDPARTLTHHTSSRPHKVSAAGTAHLALPHALPCHFLGLPICEYRVAIPHTCANLPSSEMGAHWFRLLVRVSCCMPGKSVGPRYQPRQNTNANYDEELALAA